MRTRSLPICEYAASMGLFGLVREGWDTTSCRGICTCSSAGTAKERRCFCGTAPGDLVPGFADTWLGLVVGLSRFILCEAMRVIAAGAKLHL
jgi:hypothetical protein